MEKEVRVCEIERKRRERGRNRGKMETNGGESVCVREGGREKERDG